MIEQRTDLETNASLRVNVGLLDALLNLAGDQSIGGADFNKVIGV